MFSRRHFFAVATGTGINLALARRAQAGDPPLDAALFPPLDNHDRLPWLGLATSLYEEHDYTAQVEGILPPNLRGILYRNGPGLFDRGGLRKRCVLDGDGMVQAFRIGDGVIQYRNRFVRTEKFVEEETAGRYLYATWTTQAPGGRFANLFGRTIRNQAGVSVIRKHDRLYAFDESAEPYELDPDTLDTIGLSRLGLAKGTALYSAHSKTDGQTGEWLHFGLEYGRTITVHLTTFHPNGSLKSHRTVSLPRYAYIHDYFVSDRYLIFNVHPAEIAIFRFLLGSASLTGSMQWRPEQGNLVLVIPRAGDATAIEFTTEATWMWHTLNAYEQGDEIIADFVGYDSPTHFLGNDPLFFAIMAGRRGMSTPPGSVRRYIINVKGRSIRQEILAEGHYEFPIVNPRHACHAHRYGYVARGDSQSPFWSQVTRLDTQTGKTDSYDFGGGVYCTEPIFAPEPGYDYTTHASEEPGWLFTEGYDSRTGKSFLAILRADRLSDGPVAVAHLRHHVPLSFHGYWYGLEPAATQNAKE